MYRLSIFALLLVVAANPLLAKYPASKSYMLSKKYVKDAPDLGLPYPLATSLEVKENPRALYPNDPNWYKVQVNCFAMKRIYRLAIGLRNCEGLEFRGLPKEDQLFEMVRGGELVFQFEYRQIGRPTRADLVIWHESTKGQTSRSQLGLFYPKHVQSRDPKGAYLVGMRVVTEGKGPKSELAPWER